MFLIANKLIKKKRRRFVEETYCMPIPVVEPRFVIRPACCLVTIPAEVLECCTFYKRNVIVESTLVTVMCVLSLPLCDVN
jgi:hypothetical protein